MKSFQLKLGEAVITVVFLALYFDIIATSLYGLFWLFAVVGSSAILVPAYLVSLLMWRHHFGPRPAKDGDLRDEL
jgi:hypothetical protein